MATTVKITKKGQVTIPQAIREQLNCEVVEFVLAGNDIVMRPVKSVAGSLSPYGKKGSLPFREARDKAWDEAVRERHGAKTDRR